MQHVELRGIQILCLQDATFVSKGKNTTEYYVLFFSICGASLTVEFFLTEIF